MYFGERYKTRRKRRWSRSCKQYIGGVKKHLPWYQVSISHYDELGFVLERIHVRRGVHSSGGEVDWARIQGRT